MAFTVKSLVYLVFHYTWVGGFDYCLFHFVLHKMLVHRVTSQEVTFQAPTALGFHGTLLGVELDMVQSFITGTDHASTDKMLSSPRLSTIRHQWL